MIVEPGDTGVKTDRKLDSARGGSAGSGGCFAVFTGPPACPFPTVVRRWWHVSRSHTGAPGVRGPFPGIIRAVCAGRVLPENRYLYNLHRIHHCPILTTTHFMCHRRAVFRDHYARQRIFRESIRRKPRSSRSPRRVTGIGERQPAFFIVFTLSARNRCLLAVR